MRTMHLSRAVLLLAIAVACGEGTDPSVEDVAGTYVATTLTTTESGVTNDQLARGAAITLVLSASGTVSGSFVAVTDQNAQITRDMAGTWTLSGSTVTFDQSADTFIRDMDFVVQGDALAGDQLFGPTRVRIILAKQ